MLIRLVTIPIRVW